ncbi:hypothetical protein ACIP93_34525 [Streptomyces sp. NPDC088745]|uniref:hypothetical protein n=1 Tax=Streptomyces sp. NPDC088745 TaxID=3365884 RepID=UPI00382EE3E5
MNVGLEVGAVEFGFHLILLVVLSSTEHHLNQIGIEIRKKSTDSLTTNGHAAFVTPQHVREFVSDDVVLVRQRSPRIKEDEVPALHGNPHAARRGPVELGRLKFDLAPGAPLDLGHQVADAVDGREVEAPDEALTGSPLFLIQLILPG